MIPAAWRVLAALPLTPSGKVDHRALPAPEFTGGSAGYVAPDTPAQKALAGIWAEVLGVDRVGAEDNFFELGGDSIVSIQVVSRARQAGLGLTPRDLFRYPTIAELARAAGSQAGAPAAEQGEVTGPAELTPVQRWFFEQDVPAPQYFGQSVTVELSGSPDPGVLEAALGALLAHHDALRMRFTRDAGGHWHQHNAPADPVGHAAGRTPVPARCRWPCCRWPGAAG